MKAGCDRCFGGWASVRAWGTAAEAFGGGAAAEAQMADLGPGGAHPGRAGRV